MFHCVVVGDPKPTVHWKNSSGIIITSGGRFDVFSNNSLKISNLLKSDDGSFFTCEAENSYGKTAASTTLYVNGEYQRSCKKCAFSHPFKFQEWEIFIQEKFWILLCKIHWKCGATRIKVKSFLEVQLDIKVTVVLSIACWTSKEEKLNAVYFHNMTKLNPINNEEKIPNFIV